MSWLSFTRPLCPAREAFVHQIPQTGVLLVRQMDWSDDGWHTTYGGGNAEGAWWGDWGLYIRPAGGWSSISLLPFTFIEISYVEKAVLIYEVWSDEINSSTAHVINSWWLVTQWGAICSEVSKSLISLLKCVAWCMSLEDLFRCWAAPFVSAWKQLL